MDNFQILFFLGGLLFGALIATLIFNYKINVNKKTNEILDPLKKDIEAFNELYSSSVGDEKIQRESLKTEIETLNKINAENIRINQSLSKDAQDLTAAFKADNKIQGLWGEKVLENIMKSSGLRRNFDYQRESDLNTDYQDSIGRADYIVKISNGGSIIIDAKLSFNSFKDYTNAKTNDEKKQHMKDLISKTRAHVNTLSKRNYWTSKKLKTPDFVFLFIPLDNLFHVVTDNDKEIYDDAFKKKIIFVTPSTLRAALMTIDVLWRETNLSENAEKIATEAGQLYNKISTFYDYLNKSQKSMIKALENNHSAIKNLCYGTGNLKRRAENIRDLGAKNITNEFELK